MALNHGEEKGHLLCCWSEAPCCPSPRQEAHFPSKGRSWPFSRQEGALGACPAQRGCGPPGLPCVPHPPKGTGAALSFLPTQGQLLPSASGIIEKQAPHTPRVVRPFNDSPRVGLPQLCPSIRVLKPTAHRHQPRSLAEPDAGSHPREGLQLTWGFKSSPKIRGKKTPTQFKPGASNFLHKGSVTF